jgi:hypothetical protein
MGVGVDDDVVVVPANCAARGAFVSGTDVDSTLRERRKRTKKPSQRLVYMAGRKRKRGGGWEQKTRKQRVCLRKQATEDETCKWNIPH